MKINLKRKVILGFCAVFLMGNLLFTGCGMKTETDQTTSQDTESSNIDQESATGQRADLELKDLVSEGKLELSYAKNFEVEQYQNGYRMIRLADGSRYFVIPEGEKNVKGLEEGTVVLQQPLNHLYLAASAVMDMFRYLEAIDTITLSGQQADGWYINEAKEAMQRGDMVYAGKYNKPDYEQILAKNCPLAIENKMILHVPEVMEKLEGFGIPVFVDHSSYESHPMGRMEWIKCYGVLLGKEEMAEQIFAEQEEQVQKVMAEQKTGKTAAFFFITSNGMVQVRQSSDYVPVMIRLAGGEYVFEDLGDPQSARSTMNMQVEEFYYGAKDADFLIYNSAIDGGVDSLEELLDKCGVLKDFKAVQDGNVWCTSNDLYQQSMSIGYLIQDMHTMFIGGEETEMTYLYHLK